MSLYSYVKMKKNIILILIALFQHVSCLSTIPEKEYNKDFQVKTSNGVLQGKYIVSEFKNVSFYGFFGIPYAQPPVGDLRFRPPEPALNWTGVLDARAERSKCPQLSQGSEDCLYLNVYTPQKENRQENENLLPVIVQIHGGAFIFGSSDYNKCGPDYLIEHDVIVVAFNYRLGLFGFLSTGDMSLPGNYALKDQIEVLKWVQRNIQYFGGNSSQVTIIGESAGAASVHYLLQTPLANGLFHKAISLSGCTLCYWSLYREPRKIAFRVAELLGIETNTTEELVTKLRSVGSEELATVGEDVLMEELQNIYDDGLPFSPCIEPEHETAVITTGTYGLLSANRFNKVPLLTGFNSQEAALLLMALDMIKPLLAIKDASPSTFVHKNMNISSNITKEDVGLAIKSFYFGKSLASTAPMDKIFDFLSDDMFLRPIYKTVQLHSHSVPVYFYRFSYETPITFFGKRTFKGVAHGEQQGYIFFQRGNSTTFTTDVSVSPKIVKMWTNFVKTGNPTPIPEKLLDYVTWPVAYEKRNSNENNNLTFLDINDHLTVSVNPREQAIKFWEDLFQKYTSVDGTY